MGTELIDEADSDRAAIVELASNFARKEVLHNVEEWECTGELPRTLHRAAGEAGLLGLGFPEELGGGGSHLDLMAVFETMIRLGVPTGVLSSLFSHSIAVPSLIKYGSKDLRDRYARPTLAGDLIGAFGLTEPDGGSDVAALRTKAVRDGDHYVINGSKTFITSGVRADYVTVAARTGAEGHSGISLIVIDAGTPGFTVTRKLEKMGWHSSDTAELSFVEVRVPVANLVGQENAGFRMIMEQLESERLTMAVECTAVAERCLELTMDWVRERRTFGEALASRQVVRHKIAEMARQTAVARTFVWETARRWKNGDAVGAEVAMAKNTGVYACEHVVHEAVQLHGGMGFMRGTEVERHYRDIRIMGIGGGTNEILNDLIAKRIGL